MPRKITPLVVPLLLAGGLLAVPLACGEGDAPAVPAEAGLPDAGLLSDAALDANDAAIPIGDLCGDASGLAPNSPWPMRGGCPKRAAAVTTSGPDDSSVEWSIALAGSKSTPVVDASGLIWVGSSAGDVYAFRRNGDIQSTFHVAGAVDASAAVNKDGLVLFATHEGTLYGLAQAFPMVDGGPDASTDEAGTPLSRVLASKMIGDSGESPAVGADGTIYVGTHDGKLNAIAADLTVTIWSAPIGGDASATLAADGTVYAGSTDGKVYAFDPTGTSKWTFATGAAIVAPVAVGGDETIYAASTDGVLYALDPDGKMKWKYAAGGPLRSTPAVLGGVVYVGSDDKKLHAVRSDTGAGKWTYATLGAVASPAVAKDGTVYVGSADGHLYAVTPGGSLYFAVNAKGVVSGPPAFGSDGTLYLATSTGVLAVSR